MTVTDQQVAALRALLAGNRAEHKRLLGQINSEAGKLGFAALVNGAFFEAVDRRFSRETTQAEIIEYVADVRSRLDEVAAAVEPRVAEELIGKVLGKAPATDIDRRKSSTAKLLLLGALIADEQLDSTRLDEFMATARKNADHLLG